MWHLHGAPAPRDPGSGLITIGDVQYPNNWPHDDLVALGLTWAEPEPVVPDLESCLARLASVRWQKTQTMPSYDGAVDVPADTARSVVTSKILASQFMAEEEKTIKASFKLKPGEWRMWDLYDLVAYGLAIGAYMQACFDQELALAQLLIDAEDPSTVDLEVGWPE